MNTIEYTRMAEREANYWWHIGRLSIIETYLKRYAKNGSKLKILNIGCGTGGTLALLEKYGKVDNVDVSEEAIEFMRKSGYKKVIKVDGIKLPLKDHSYDLVVAFDVLEHINDDVDALKEWRRVLKPGGSVVLTVPAYQWLWSDHDISLQHYRRHTLKSISTKAGAANLAVDSKSYAFVFSLPMVVGFRGINKLIGRKIEADTSYVDLPKAVNGLFTHLLKIEAQFHKYVRFPAGTSVVATLRREVEELEAPFVKSTADNDLAA